MILIRSGPRPLHVLLGPRRTSRTFVRDYTNSVSLCPRLSFEGHRFRLFLNLLFYLSYYNPKVDFTLYSDNDSPFYPSYTFRCVLVFIKDICRKFLPIPWGWRIRTRRHWGGFSRHTSPPFHWKVTSRDRLWCSRSVSSVCDDYLVEVSQGNYTILPWKGD